MIKTSVIGHLGRDAVVKEINSKKVIEFSVAHSESFKNAEGVKIERTVWVNCSYWSDRTAVAQYLKKGVQVYVEGQPSVDAYINNEHKPTAALRLRVNHIQLLSSNRQEQTQNEKPAETGAAATSPADYDGPDDLPF